MAERTPTLGDLNERSRAIFARLVETYLDSGAPVGSRTLARAIDLNLSAATVRNTMQDLEHLGLLNSPHTSAGRVPTQLGLRLFVDGVLEIGDISSEEREQIEASLGKGDGDVPAMLDQVGAMLSGLSHCTSLVFAPKQEAPIRHIEFISLSDNQALAVLVMEDGTVENRIFESLRGLTPSQMREAANFLNAHLRGRTLGEARDVITEKIAARRAELDGLAAELVERGIALWHSGDPGSHERLIVRGRANLLGNEQDVVDVERMRHLFDDLEQLRDLAQLIDLTEAGEGVRVFIGSENKLFSMSDSALVIAPYTDGARRVIGALGVVGPTRLNYGRIVPIVDFTARLLSRMVSEGGAKQTNNRGT